MERIEQVKHTNRYIKYIDNIIDELNDIKQKYIHGEVVTDNDYDGAMKTFNELLSLYINTKNHFNI